MENYLHTEKDPRPRNPSSVRSNLYFEKKGDVDISNWKSSAKHSSPITLLFEKITDGETNEYPLKKDFIKKNLNQFLRWKVPKEPQTLFTVIPKLW